VFVSSEFRKKRVAVVKNDKARNLKHLSRFSPDSQPKVTWEKGPRIES
jgi:hypothetical protein